MARSTLATGRMGKRVALVSITGQLGTRSRALSSKATAPVRTNGPTRELDPLLLLTFGVRSPVGAGVGTFKWGNGNVYSGEWLRDNMEGRGTFTWGRSGDTYEGEFKSDRKHGHGKWTRQSDGKTYVGEWFNDKRHGQGKESHPVIGDCMRLSNRITSLSLSLLSLTRVHWHLPWR